ncbi:MAG TPA: hypothetical protein VN715_14225 [Roseiarcus sp.]|nr:hypothetical protein [Roseiarcus sp.]
MADYYSLLARAVANLPKSSPPSTRRAIYERARKALTNQLRSLKPPLPESDIAREERALDEAVTRLETEFEPTTADIHTLPIAAAAAADLAEAPAAPPAPPPLPRPAAAAARPAAPVKAPPIPPRAPIPRPAAAGLPNAAAFKAPLLGGAEPPPAESAPLPEPELAAARADAAAEAAAPPLGGAASRYEREPARPILTDGGRRRGSTWLWIAGAVAVGFAGSIAVAAFLMRPALRDLSVPAAIDTPAAAAKDTVEKSARRVGEPAATASAAPAPAATPAPTSPPPTIAAAPLPSASPSPVTTAAPVVAPTADTTPPSATTVPIAGRAAMLVATVADAAKPAISVGTAVWSVVPAPPGQPAGIGVKAEIDIPDLKLHASMIMRKNFDASLPASHTIDLRVTFDPGSSIKGIKDIALPLMRRDDPPAADALTGVRVKISDNYFLVGLNRNAADVTRNTQEIAERTWFDFPMQLDDDRIAKLTFEKGADGEKIVAEALAAWK